MKYIDEYRDGDGARFLRDEIARRTTKAWTLMEVCGGQTHAIVKYGIDALLPPTINLVHGPGCPVCVTPLELIDKAIQIAARPDVIFCSFGDMLRVPGSERDLFSVKGSGGNVRIIYSPLDAVNIARERSDKEVVFFAVGFETTAPANALAVIQAQRAKLKNFSMLVSHVRVPPAMEAILSAPTHCVQGFLAAGHVCAVMGYEEYIPIARNYKVPIVVTGFEPMDILQGILMCVRQLESGCSLVENQYTRAVRMEGNRRAQELIRQVFEIIPRKWRGVGEIPRSGFGFTEDFKPFDAEVRFGVATHQVEESGDCISGQILQGLKKPHECPAFGLGCTPERPLGATMVSSEGACAAYYRYRGMPKFIANSGSPTSP